MQEYLAAGTYIDWQHPAIAKKAAELAAGASSRMDMIERCFRFVRDEIKHSSDYQMNPVTCRASDVLQYGTGYCYAKSHLLAALLRANAVPTALCYQRLALGAEGPPYCLHGLNAVFLEEHGWYRMDARGNKPGVDAQFCPPLEKLAFPVVSGEEQDLPGRWPEPMPAVVKVLTGYATIQEVYANLPDVDRHDLGVQAGAPAS